MRAVGIDLSLTATGIAYSDGRCFEEGLPLVTTRCIADQVVLLDRLATWIGNTTLSFEPDGVCIEGLDMARSYGGQIERTVVWWKVVEQLVAAGVLVWVAPSPQVKMYATGKGSGDKKAVVDAITRWWPQFDHRDSDNRADAASCCLIAAAMLGEPLPPIWGGAPVELSVTHTRALQSVRNTCTPPPPKKGRPKAPPSGQVRPRLTLDAPL